MSSIILSNIAKCEESCANYSSDRKLKPEFMDSQLTASWNFHTRDIHGEPKGMS
jgi:hypothetical protein